MVYGPGLSVVSRFSVEQEILNGQVREVKLEEPLFLRRVNYAHYTDKLLYQAVQNLLARLPALNQYPGDKRPPQKEAMMQLALQVAITN